MNPVIKVYSFGRSGTHWLMSLLKNRFYGSADIGQAITSDIFPFHGWDGNNFCVWGELLGGHWQHPDYAPTLKNSVYLIRDGKDVMVSWWKMLKLSDQEDLTLAQAMSKPMRDDPQNPCPPVRTATQWWWSTAQWKKVGIPIVSYEDLMEHKDEELDRIASIFDLVDDPIGKSDIPVGYCPSVPKVGKWKEHFTDDDLKLFLECQEEAENLPNVL